MDGESERNEERGKRGRESSKQELDVRGRESLKHYDKEIIKKRL